MVKLHCNHRYRNSPRHLEFEAGHHYDVTEEVAAFLAQDAPGAFTIVKPPKAKPAPAPQAIGPVEPLEVEEIEPATTGLGDAPLDKSFDAPPQDTSIKRAPRTKRTPKG